MDQKNLILAIVLSVAILLGFQLLVGEQNVAPPPGGPEAAQSAGGTTPPSAAPGATVPGATVPGATAPGGIGVPTPGDVPAIPAVPAELTRAEAIGKGVRVSIETPTLRGSIALRGARVDDLTLTNYHETIEPESKEIVLLSPNGAENPYFADFGWTGAGTDTALPNGETLWQADNDVLTPDQPVTLSWDNGAGLRFETLYKIDENYLFTVTQRVFNNSGNTVTLLPYGLISRTGTPDILGFYILHEGLLGVFDDVLKEVDYSDLSKDGPIQIGTTGGWLGITDKYWLVALVPDQKRAINARFLYDGRSGVDKYQTDFLYAGIALQPGAANEVTSHLFAGAKKVLLLDQYKEDFGFAQFDLAVDFGWFYFLTKPLFYALHYLAEKIGNFGIAILILTIGVKSIFFPLANKSYRSMAKMRKLQPEMVKLRERFGEDKQRLNQEMMALYKKEGANPLSGCLPIVVQIPVFFALYKVMFVTIEMRHAPFFGWIQDLSAPDPTSILNGFGILPWDVPALGMLNAISIGVWPLLMGISMFLQQRLNPQPPDPIQAKIFLFMPIIFTFLLARFPAGLVIYWTWNNLLSITQQYVIMRRLGVRIGRS